MDAATPEPLDPHALADQFARRTLPKACWTHEAHLVVCWITLQRHDADEAVAMLRDQIRSYNDATGTANTSTSGYHQTLTEYYVRAVDAAAINDVCDLVRHPWCAREAPSRHWSRDRLLSVDARRQWCEPDLELFPWADDGVLTPSA